MENSKFNFSNESRLVELKKKKIFFSSISSVKRSHDRWRERGRGGELLNVEEVDSIRVSIRLYDDKDIRDWRAARYDNITIPGRYDAISSRRIPSTSKARRWLKMSKHEADDRFTGRLGQRSRYLLAYK